MKQKWLKSVSAFTTVEMAYIMPVIFLAFLIVIYSAFYYHDKNIIAGMAYETAVIGAQQERTRKGMQEDELVQFFQEKAGRKLILFGSPKATVSKDTSYVVVQASASRRNMKLEVEMKSLQMEPETFIRMIRKVK